PSTTWSGSVSPAVRDPPGGGARGASPMTAQPPRPVGYPEPGAVAMPRRAGSTARIGLVLLALAPVAVCAGLLGLARDAAATEARFPLGLDYPLLQGALRRHLREQAGGALELWRTADGCGSVVMRDVTIQPREGRLRISGRTSAEAGASLFGLCWGSVTWGGYAEVVGRPEVGADWRPRPPRPRPPAP